MYCAGKSYRVYFGSDESLFWLMAKIPRDVWDECPTTAERKARTLTYEDLSVLLLELALEKESDRHLNAYDPGAATLETMAVATKDLDPLGKGKFLRMLAT